MRAYAKVAVVVGCLLYGVPAWAQDGTRIIGRKGLTQLTFAGSLSAMSTTTITPTISPSGAVTFTESDSLFGFYFGSWDFGFFGTDHVVFNVGNSFNGMLNGPGGLKPTVNLTGGALYYFSPGESTSPYFGGRYFVALVNRVDGDAGSALGQVGIQTMVSPRASIFGEIAYGGAVKEFSSSALSLSVGVRVQF